ncbi:MAG: PD-(D/E)XK nuclease family protein [archaeon]
MIYSHSRLSSFEQCPLKFKFNYIDQIETEIEQSIEAFMGSLVHETLEKLYKDLKYEKKNEIRELLDYYNNEWEKRYNDKILIVKKEYNAENYKKMGEKYIAAYYESHKPFDGAQTIGTELRIEIKLDPEGKYVLQGYIDRLACSGDTYEIHDYKTSGTLPQQDYADADRQLALYSIAIKEQYRDAKEVKLIWHYLAFDKDIESSRCDNALSKLKEDTVELIKKIESTSVFEPSVSALCDWCEFRSICPRWKHLINTENLPTNEYRNESGVILADKYEELSRDKQKIEYELEKIKDAIFYYCTENNIDTVFGSEIKLSCRTYDNLKFPGKNEPLRAYLEAALRKLGKYDDVCEIDVFKLSKIMKSREWPPVVVNALMNFATEEKTRRIYTGKR